MRVVLHFLCDSEPGEATASLAETAAAQILQRRKRSELQREGNYSARWKMRLMLNCTSLHSMARYVKRMGRERERVGEEEEERRRDLLAGFFRQHRNYAGTTQARRERGNLAPALSFLSFFTWPEEQPASLFFLSPPYVKKESLFVEVLEKIVQAMNFGCRVDPLPSLATGEGGCSFK